MAQLSDDCFAFGGKLITTAEARALLETRIDVVAETETAPLGAALGRILASDLAAPIAVPARGRSDSSARSPRYGSLDAGAPE